jgi:hypothetical protein
MPPECLDLTEQRRLPVELSPDLDALCRQLRRQALERL